MTHILNIVIPSIVGAVAVKVYLQMRNKQIIEKKKRLLNSQFRDLLDSLTTAIGAGKNVPESFLSAKEDLLNQYNEDADIVKEVEVILSGLKNNINIEDLLMDFAKRSANKDIESFANVFKVSYRKGGNIKDIIRNTHDILSDKLEINEEVITTIASSKFNLNIMTFMPIFMVAAIKMMSPDFAANFASSSGVVATTVAVVIFVISYFVGKKIMVIKL